MPRAALTDRHHPARTAGRTGRRLVGALGATVLGHYLPSTCVLAQWSPVVPEQIRGGWCRWRGPSDDPLVALTFDDGPSPASTLRTLDLLDELEMRATFFVLGCLAGVHPELVGEMRRRGHTVASHGYRHEHHLLRSPAWISRDFDAAADVYEDLDLQPRWYRPTYGQLTAWTAIESRRRGMDVVLWSRWGREWAETSADPVLDRLRTGLVPGAVLLLHDTDESCPTGTAARVHEVLPRLADELSRRQLRAVTLDELLDTADRATPGTGGA